MGGASRSREKTTVAPAAARSRASGSVEVSSPPPRPAFSFRCDVGWPCPDYLRFHEMKEQLERGDSVARSAWMQPCPNGTSLGNDDAEDSVGDRLSLPRRGSSCSAGESSAGDDNSDNSSSPVSSVSVVPEGTEDEFWGGVELESKHRCRHGKHTGRRFLGCPLKGNAEKCRFVKWMDEEWPTRAQQAICSLWDMVGQFIEKANASQVDAMAAVALRNEAYEEKEALISQKEELERQMQDVVRQKDELL
ncbi:unnamed protein product [Urochloa humidicola]